MIIRSRGAHMPRFTHSLLRRRSLWSVATGLSCVGALAIDGCQYDDSDWQLDQESGASSSRGGSSSGSSGKGQSGSQSGAGQPGEPAGGAPSVAGTAGKVGTGGSVAQYPKPQIDSMEPSSGPYGTPVTIKGLGLGNAAIAGFTLAVGNQGEVTLNPKDKTSVVSWT